MANEGKLFRVRVELDEALEGAISKLGWTADFGADNPQLAELEGNATTKLIAEGEADRLADKAKAKGYEIETASVAGDEELCIFVRDDEEYLIAEITVVPAED